MVSKFKTVEKNAVDSLVAFAMIFGLALAGGLGTAVHAKEKDSDSSSKSSAIPYTEISKICQDMGNKKGTAEFNKCVEEREKKSQGGSSKEGCDKEWEDLDDALEAANKSCSAAGITNGKQKGFPACAGGMALCSCTDDPTDSKCPEGAGSEESESDRAGSDGGSGVDLNKERFNSEFCPAMSKADLKDFKEEVKESQKTVDELENEIPGLQDSINTAESELNTKLSDLEEQKKVAQKEYNDGKKELERSKKDNIKALEEKISGIQDQIFKVEADIRTALLSKSEVSLKRDESIKAIKLSCHSVATQEASARRMKIFADIKAGTYRKGGFLTALKSVGLSDRKEDQLYAEKLYKNCLSSKQTKEAIDSANKMATLSLNQIDGTILSLQKQAGQLNDSISKIKNQAGCGNAAGGADSSEMCRVLTEFQEDRVQLDNEALQNATKIGNDIIRARNEAANSMATKQEALARKQQQLVREQQYLADKKEALALKLRANGASGATSEKVATAWGDLGSLEAVIRRIKTTGCCSGYSKEETGKGRCAEIDGYMAAYDREDPAVEGALEKDASEVDSRSGSTGKDIVDATKAAKTTPQNGSQKVNRDANANRQDTGVREGTPRPTTATAPH